MPGCRCSRPSSAQGGSTTPSPRLARWRTSATAYRRLRCSPLKRTHTATTFARSCAEGSTPWRRSRPETGGRTRRATSSRASHDCRWQTTSAAASRCCPATRSSMPRSRSRRRTPRSATTTCAGRGWSRSSRSETRMPVRGWRWRICVAATSSPRRTFATGSRCCLTSASCARSPARSPCTRPPTEPRSARGNACAPR